MRRRAPTQKEIEIAAARAVLRSAGLNPYEDRDDPVPSGNTKEEKLIKKRKLAAVAKRMKTYEPEYATIARNFYAVGGYDTLLAKHLGIDMNTFNRWRAKYVKFREACRVGDADADHAVVESLFKQAVGYYDAEGTWHPPSFAATAFWLKNRRPDIWRDRREYSGPDGGPLQIQQLILDPARLATLTSDQLEAYNQILTMIIGDSAPVSEKPSPSQIRRITARAG